MNTMAIGTSGLKSPAMGLGTWAIGGGSLWGDNDDTVSIETIRKAITYGITWIDTAPVYGLGHSERVVGEAIKDMREKVLLSTKCGLSWTQKEGTFHKRLYDQDVYRNLTPKGIRTCVEESLTRLQTDYIDILYTHWQSEDPMKTPIGETMDALMKLKGEGKIRAIGASNVTADDIEQYVKYGKLDVIQEKYSLLDRRIETDLFSVCKKHDVSIQAYSPLEQGLLAGKVTMDTVLSSTDVRASKPHWQRENRRRILAMLDGWKDLTMKYQCSIANLVIAWTACQYPSMNVLCGARKPAQIEDNANALFLDLESEDQERMTLDASTQSDFTL